MSWYADVEHEGEDAVILHEHIGERPTCRGKLVVEISVYTQRQDALRGSTLTLINSLDLDLMRHSHSVPLVGRPLARSYFFRTQTPEQFAASKPVLRQKAIRVSRNKPALRFYPFQYGLLVERPAYILSAPLCLFYVIR